VLSELELDFDLDAIGFETAEIDVLIDGLETVSEPDPDDRLPAIETSAVSVSGDLWQLGKHRVLCGNSLISENYERLMDGAKADLVITSRGDFKNSTMRSMTADSRSWAGMRTWESDSGAFRMTA
jgi:hypothetical protein